MWPLSPKPSQKSVIRAYIECAEFLRFEVPGVPDTGGYPATALTMLSTSQLLAVTYRIAGVGSSRRMAPNAATDIQVKLDAIKAMSLRRQLRYTTPIENKMLYPMIWDGIEFKGNVTYKELKKKPVDYYTAIKKEMEELMAVNCAQGHTVFTREKQIELYKSQVKDMERFEARMLQRGLII